MPTSTIAPVRSTATYTTVALAGLGAHLVARWSELQALDPTLSSPFFRPEYHVLIDTACRAATTTRADGPPGGPAAPTPPNPPNPPNPANPAIPAIPPGPVEVVVQFRGDDPATPTAFLPFQRHPVDPRIGLPAGQPLTDHQGIIAVVDGAAAPVDPAPFLRSAGLHTWRFDHVPVTQRGFASSTATTERSPVIDLGDGFDEYAAANRAARIEQRTHRRLEREVGPVRFEPHTEDPGVLARLMAWKSRQYVATGATDLFAVPWCRMFAEQLATTRGDAFAGTVSALWAGDALVAAHLGLRSGPVWHYWIPAYDPAMGRHSPGTALLLAMARWGAANGVTAIDLGKGDQPYKDRLATSAITLATGAVEIPNAGRDLKRLGRRAADRLRPARSTAARTDQPSG